MKSYKSRQGSRKWRKQGHKPWWFYMETYGDKGRTMYQRNGNHNSSSLRNPHFWDDEDY